jgi:hypothetical protein
VPRPPMPPPGTPGSPGPRPLFAPIDPATVSVAYLKERTGLLFAAMERGEIPDMPPPAGWFRCFTCRREFEGGATDEEAGEEYRRRFGGAPGERFTLCDDCNRIIAHDQGASL